MAERRLDCRATGSLLLGSAISSWKPILGIHHPRFGYFLKEKMDKLWIECTVGVKGDFAGKPPGQQQRDGVDFFRRQHHA